MLDEPPPTEATCGEDEIEPEDGEQFVPGLFFLSMCLEMGRASCVTPESPTDNE